MSDAMHRPHPLDPGGPLGVVTLEGDRAALSRAAFIACVPAQDEAGHISRCLAALDRELARGDAILLFCNDCRDDTAAIARALTQGFERPFLLLDGRWRPGEGSAPRARACALHLAHELSPGAVLFSTDGDTLAEPGLRAAYTAEFERGFDLVCGAIAFIEAEARDLHHPEPERDVVVAAYRALTARIEAQLAPDADNPFPHHGNIGGANFAIRGEAFARIGGMPTPPFGEDRALRRLCERHGLRVRYSPDPRVSTSCRLDGRARGGLADELLRDRREADPIVDERLEPPERLLLRLRARAAFLEASTTADRHALLSRLGLGPEDAARLSGEPAMAGWHDAEDLSLVLARRRLRLSDLRAHLPALERTAHELEGAPSGRGPSRADR